MRILKIHGLPAEFSSAINNSVYPFLAARGKKRVKETSGAGNNCRMGVQKPSVREKKSEATVKEADSIYSDQKESH